MKKALIVLLAVALIGAFAFADDAAAPAAPTAAFSIHTYNGFGIVSSGTTTTIKQYDYNWVGGDYTRVGFKYTAADGNSGFNSRVQVSFGTTTSGTTTSSAVTAVFNQLNGWGKFVDGLITVRAGVGDDYTIATPIWNCYGNTDGAFGVYVNLHPADGLDIGYFQPIPYSSDVVANLVSPTASSKSIVGAAYAIKDVASLEAGAVLSSATNGTNVYFGGNVTAITGLTAQLEGQIASLGASASTTTLLEYLGYSFGDLSLASYIGENLGTKVYFGLEPIITYKLSSLVSVVAIINAYNNPSQTWYSPIDAGVVGGGTAGTFNFGAGAAAVFTAGGLSFRAGDYYAAGSSSNILYVNADLTL